MGNYESDERTQQRREYPQHPNGQYTNPQDTSENVTEQKTNPTGQKKQGQSSRIPPYNEVKG
ncbi:MAG: hypothetical protein KC496_05230, partial [Anaerolineae bacterium]|nr:hypothetical protein [Anaerolineae bacterium]